ncbi:MAG: S-adenosylmethionine:tRNA ribosyltransferase-isomerase, partial [Prevotellaceae bacterium]|nr:S-adenosylmethionine:tRNA ribosyltransferase-isomerase [Prevotellaceae bacterium]
PYLHRDTEASDKETYQTVYARPEGSVAAPTAGLHFTPDVLRAIDARGIERAEVTLHVGAGTFRPVKSELIAGHEMHTESFAVSLHTLRRLIAHDARAIAVGTTSVRTLESLYYMGAALISRPDLTEAQLCVRQWQPYDTPADLPAVDALRALSHYMERHRLDTLHTGTQIIIAPGYRYRIVRAMVTNFHQPQSTLLLLVSAFVGERWRDIYDYALAHHFRFLSYGDSSLLIP